MKKILILSVLFLFTGSCLSQWVLQQSPTSMSLRKLRFINSSTGFMVSYNEQSNIYVVFKTVNSGISWDSTLFGTAEVINNIFFLNESTGWLIGQVNTPVPGKGMIWKTTNFGNTWDNQVLDDSLNLYDVFFPSTNTGYFSANKTGGQPALLRPEIYKTTNAGVNWVRLNSVFNDTTTVYGLYFINDNTGWVASKYLINQFIPAVSKTTDGGNSWSDHIVSFPFSNRGTMHTLKFFNDSTGYLVGYRDVDHIGDTPEGIICKSTNGGINWVKQTIDQEPPFIHYSHGSFFLNPDTGWVVGSRGSIIRISDGNNWKFQQSGLNWNLSQRLRDVQFVSGTGWVVGDSGKILKTTNFGAAPEFILSGTVRYQDNNQSVTSGYVKAIKHSSTSGDLVVLDSVPILADGSYRLTRVPQDTLDLMAFDDDETLSAHFVPTYYPSSIEWQDAESIYPQSNLSGLDINVFRMVHINSATGNISGSVFLNLSEAFGLQGIQDARIYAKMGNDFRGYSFSSAAGYYYIDSLQRGFYQLICNRAGYPTRIRYVFLWNNNLSNIDFIYGGGLVGINEISGIPDAYSLGQNFPNPFNPQTTIRFGLPTNEYVRLVIFDILGREITRVIDEKLSAGEYKYEFDMSSYPSGVYFYKLETVNFTASRKMVLLK